MSDNFFSVVFEEVIVFTVTNCQEIKQVSHVHIIRDRAEVAYQLSIQVQHVFQVSTVAYHARPSDIANFPIKFFNFSCQI